MYIIRVACTVAITASFFLWAAIVRVIGLVADALVLPASEDTI
jgi:hypothetical protein